VLLFDCIFFFFFLVTGFLVVVAFLVAVGFGVALAVVFEEGLGVGVEAVAVEVKSTADKLVATINLIFTLCSI